MGLSFLTLENVSFKKKEEKQKREGKEEGHRITGPFSRPLTFLAKGQLVQFREVIDEEHISLKITKYSTQYTCDSSQPLTTVASLKVRCHPFRLPSTCLNPCVNSHCLAESIFHTSQDSARDVLYVKRTTDLTFERRRTEIRFWPRY